MSQTFWKSNAPQQSAPRKCDLFLGRNRTAILGHHHVHSDPEIDGPINPISDSEVSEGEDEYVARPLPKFPVPAARQRQDNGLAMLSAAYEESEEDGGENRGTHTSPGDNFRDGISNDVTSTAQQDAHLDGHACIRTGEFPNFLEYRPSNPLND